MSITIAQQGIAGTVFVRAAGSLPLQVVSAAGTQYYATANGGTLIDFTSALAVGLEVPLLFSRVFTIMNQGVTTTGYQAVGSIPVGWSLANTTLTSIVVNSAGLATVTIPTVNHGLSTGSSVVVAGCLLAPNLNGTYVIASTAQNTLTFTFQTVNVAAGTYTDATLNIQTVNILAFRFWNGITEFPDGVCNVTLNVKLNFA